LDPLVSDREILIAAIREQLGLAEEAGDDIPRRKAIIMEATRLGVRLVEVQKRLEDDYDQ
jgi:hypothetical protein